MLSMSSEGAFEAPDHSRRIEFYERFLWRQLGLRETGKLTTWEDGMNRRDFLKGVGGIIGLREMSGMRSPTLAEAPAVGGIGSGGNAAAMSQPDYAALLRQHDIVYLTPTDYGPEGLPIGNGDLMGQVWMPSEGLELGLNKANLWDDRITPPPLAENWSWDAGEEEQWTAPVSGARLRIHSRLPLIDPLYLDAFQARLNLHEARVSMESSS